MQASGYGKLNGTSDCIKPAFFPEAQDAARATFGRSSTAAAGSSRSRPQPQQRSSPQSRHQAQTGHRQRFRRPLTKTFRPCHRKNEFRPVPAFTLIKAPSGRQNARSPFSAISYAKTILLKNVFYENRWTLPVRRQSGGDRPRFHAFPYVETANRAYPCENVQAPNRAVTF